MAPGDVWNVAKEALFPLASPRILNQELMTWGLGEARRVTDRPLGGGLKGTWILLTGC